MILLLQHIITVRADATEKSDACQSLSCGNSSNGFQIRFPFRLKDKQPIPCGYSGFELTCTDNNETEIDLPFSGKFLVKDINYRSQIIEIYDQNDCIPGRLLNFNISNSSPFKPELDRYVSYFNCSMDLADVQEFSYGAVSCLSSPSLAYKVFGLDSQVSFAYFLPDNCVLSSASIKWPSTMYPSEYYKLLNGWYPGDGNLGSLFMKWDEPSCGSCEIFGGKCRYKNHNSSLSVECFEIPRPYHKLKGIDYSLIL